MEKDIFDTLKGLVANRVFPDFAPVETLRPYITWQQVGGQVINNLANTTPDKKNALIQVNIWADTRAAANPLALQVENALRTSSLFTAIPEGAFVGDYDADVPVFGTSQDFSIWSAR
jgi:hypothetical protein